LGRHKYATGPILIEAILTTQVNGHPIVIFANAVETLARSTCCPTDLRPLCHELNVNRIACAGKNSPPLVERDGALPLGEVLQNTFGSAFILSEVEFGAYVEVALAHLPVVTFSEGAVDTIEFRKGFAVANPGQDARGIKLRRAPVSVSADIDFAAATGSTLPVGVSSTMAAQICDLRRKLVQAPAAEWTGRKNSSSPQRWFGLFEQVPVVF
jgi:hypothetical protein